jgi:hypothetical protein
MPLVLKEHLGETPDSLPQILVSLRKIPKKPCFLNGFKPIKDYNSFEITSLTLFEKLTWI